MRDSRNSISIGFEQFFYLMYYCWHEPWWNILVFLLILLAVAVAETTVRARRVTPGEDWVVEGKELKRIR